MYRYIHKYIYIYIYIYILFVFSKYMYIYPWLASLYGCYLQTETPFRNSMRDHKVSFHHEHVDSSRSSREVVSRHHLHSDRAQVGSGGGGGGGGGGGSAGDGAPEYHPLAADQRYPRRQKSTAMSSDSIASSSSQV